MKKLLAVAVLILLSAIGAQGQTTTTFSITVQAPVNCTVTIAPNPNSTSGLKLYSGQAGSLNFNVSACPAFVLSTATATWDGTALVLSGSLSAAVTAAEATVGTHSVVLTIPQPVLALNTPVTLPNALAKTAYTANLGQLARLAGTSTSQSFRLVSGSLPAGLSLSASGLVTGTTSSVGSFSFTYSVTDTSQLALLILPRKSTIA